MMEMFQGMGYVYAVYQEGSVSKAAKQLCISQPSLSANIKRIEDRIGYPLFDRSTKPLTLTECGETYIHAVEQMMETEREFVNYVNDWGILKTGSLILGGSSLFASWVLPGLIGKFSGQYPGIRVELVEESTLTLLDLLQKGRIDIVMDNCQPVPSVLERQIYREETLFLAAPKKMCSPDLIARYAVSRETVIQGTAERNEILPVPLQYFKNKPFIMLKLENDTRKRSMEILQENQIEPQIVLELDQQLTSYHVACSGLGAAFISDTLICAVSEQPDVVYFRLPGKKSSRKISFYWKAGRYKTRAMEEFLKTVGKEK